MLARQANLLNGFERWAESLARIAAERGFSSRPGSPSPSDANTRLSVGNAAGQVRPLAG